MTDLLPADALTGKHIALSVSDSADRARLGLTDDHVRLALGEIARAVLVAGGGLLYGGHLEPDGYTPFLVEEFQRWQLAQSQHDEPDGTGDRADDGDPSSPGGDPSSPGGDPSSPGGDPSSQGGDRTSRGKGQLLLCLAWSVHRQTRLSRIAEFDNIIHTGGEVVCLSAEGHRVASGTGRGEDPAPETDPRVVADSLTGLRRWMRDHSHGRVVVGGRRSGSRGTMPGVLEEALLSLEAGQPLYLAGGFGGVALDIARALEVDTGTWPPPLADAEEPHPGLAAGLAALTALRHSPTWDGLRNGLTDQENARLATTHRPSEIAALISRGIGSLLR